MNRKLFLPIIALFVIGACNNNTEEKKAEDTVAAVTTGTHDMNHAPVSGAVPELPAVPEGAKVFFKGLQDNATVSSPLKVEMGTDLIRVDTAGPVISGVGHHHLLIDAGDSMAAGTIIPMDSAHMHFGKGQVQTEVKLKPGKHRLTLQFADGLHRSYGGKMATSITVTVKE
jgi:hypothetical protein